MSAVVSWLEAMRERGPLGNDDALHAVVPFLEQLAACHERGQVAPTAGLAGLAVADDQLYFASDAAQAPSHERLALQRIDPESHAGVEISDEVRADHVDEARSGSLLVRRDDEPITRPQYLAGWISWEQEIGHHDAPADVLVAGLLLAALVTGEDLGGVEGLDRFVDLRHNLFAANPDLHPVIARVITGMTEPSRHRRLQDLPAIIALLRGYRRQHLAAADADLVAAADAKPGDARSLILTQLRERLFDISRRNRLLYFKPTLGMVGMTEASIPLRLDPKRINPNELFTWTSATVRRVASGKPIPMGEVLRFEDAPYLPGVLDRLRSEDRKVRAELGFSMLRLALVFLRWHNLKDNPAEAITSPLLLLPVTIDKRKGVRDAYLMTPTSDEAEVNPVLRHHLQQVYGLRLPETVALADFDLAAFHRELEHQIHASEPGVDLALISKPAIDLVHTKARRRVEVYRRRSRLTGRGIRRHGSIDYSYSVGNFQPLGMQLFLHRVRAQDWPLATLADATPRPRIPTMVAGSPAAGGASADDTIERTSYRLSQSDHGNPYRWELDACSVVLGSFNARKMSLVRDYDQLLEQPEISTPVFDDLFTALPRAQASLASTPPPWSERFDVVPCDPTQARAVAAAADGTAFIIQGPPGTGKSQTITNLIADAVGRGKRVLFVCEKRAALDVVYHRLSQQGLDRLSCLIHDTQDDKKAFIQELRDTYEHFCDQPDEYAEHQAARASAAAAIERGRDQLARWASELTEVDGEEGLSALVAIRRLVELDSHLPALADLEPDDLPRYHAWAPTGAALRVVEQTLADLGEEPVLGKHPLRLLHRRCLVAERAVSHVQGLIETVVAKVDACQAGLAPLGDGLQLSLTPADVRALIGYAQAVSELSEHRLGHLLDPEHPAQAGVLRLSTEREALVDAVAAARAHTEHWREPFAAHDMADVLALCAQVERHWLRVLLPGFWRLRRLMRERYDFDAHAVAPRWQRLLDELQAVYTAEAAVSEHDRAFAKQYPVAPSLAATAAELLARLRDLHTAQDQLGPGPAALRALVIRDADAHASVAGIMALRPLLDALEAALDGLLAQRTATTLGDLPDALRALDDALAVLPDVAGVLADLAGGDADCYQLAISQPWSADQAEAAIVRAACDRLYRSHRSLARITDHHLSGTLARIGDGVSALRSANAACVVSGVHHGIRQHIARSSMPADQLDPAQRAWKQRYSRGRKELEHEFGKVMRYRSIRSLADDETGEVLADLKPIWLMSPLSVSDTLPLDPDAFDVVIFDEASQITLEEAVPALFRARQAIVVGDQMQLPPTRFFGSRGEAVDDAEADAESALVALEADSFLSHAAGTLPSTMLGWHYRSRFERLIDFSNAAFYRRQLLTIPDITIPQQRAPIVVSEPTAAVAATLITERPVSFHRLENGVYAKRRNASEATYIVQLVASLLTEQPKLSLGIVAFSEAQQDEIEQHLTRRAASDPAFAAVYEAACEREDDDQFMGLFVKNLENVQGDERDVIILSVCYGPDAGGKMRMNFGPINQAGGEKRLNVVFSRARRHMALVASIEAPAITNDYNDGANCLKRYLRFAAAASIGDHHACERVLAECCPDAGDQLARDPSADPVVRSIAAWLGSQGYDCDEQVGSSRFRCDLAVRGERTYRLGILIDTEAHYANPDIIEQYLQRPAVLEAFGWQLERVLARDWLEDRDAVCHRLLRALA